MARMITLNPAPKVQVAGGTWDILAADAGRYGKGLRSTLQLWDGTMQHVQCLDLAAPTAIADYIQTIATQMRRRRRPH